MSSVSILRSATALPGRASSRGPRTRTRPQQLAHVQVAGVEGQRDQGDVEAARAQPLEEAPVRSPRR